MVHDPLEDLPGPHREREQPRQGVEVLCDKDEVVVIDREEYPTPASPLGFEKRKQLGRRRVDHEPLAKVPGMAVLEAYLAFHPDDRDAGPAQ